MLHKDSNAAWRGYKILMGSDTLGGLQIVIYSFLEGGMGGEGLIQVSQRRRPSMTSCMVATAFSGGVQGALLSRIVSESQCMRISQDLVQFRTPKENRTIACIQDPIFSAEDFGLQEMEYSFLSCA